MDLTTAEILIGGDLRNTVVRGAFNPITVPEIEVLRVVHGEESVKVGKICGHVERTSRFEKSRLSGIYGKKLVDEVYPGVNGNGMEMGKVETAPEDAPKVVEKPKQAAKSTKPKTQKASLI